MLAINFQIARAESTSTANDHIINLYDNGVNKGFITNKSTIRQALADAGIPLDKNDRTEPSLDENLVAPSYEVNIYRARPVLIIDGNNQTKVISSYKTGRQIAKDAGLELRDEDKADLSVSANPTGTGAPEILTIRRATMVELTFYGKKTKVYTFAKTVGDMLDQKKISPAKSDTLSPTRQTPITEGLQIELWKNGEQTATVEETIEFTTQKINDADREPSYREVKTKGVPGKRMVTYKITMKNGVEVARQELNSLTTVEPVKQVEVVGTKFKYTGGPLSDEQITALGTCESGMTANRNSGNGFYGAFQFMPGTWRGVAPAPYNSVMPHEAPIEAQKQAVQNLLSRSSIYNQFPGCARKMQAQGIL